MSAPVYWLGKTLQLSGLVTTLYALPVGLFSEQSQRMNRELGLLLLGAAVFAVGRLVEGWGRR